MKAADEHRTFRVASLCAVLLAGWLTGCATSGLSARPDLLKFLETGKTTREEVLLTLGQASASYERDRILTYRIGEDGNKNQFVQYVSTPADMTTWQHVRYSLVLVFDEGGRLQKQQLVKVD